MNILHYTQHVLGIGHLFRSLAIDRALAPATVHLTSGGPTVTLALPPNVMHHPLPALMMDSQFTAVQTVDPETDLEATWQKRQKLLLEIYHQVKPDVILVEMFPFGRKRFARELLPLLEANRGTTKPAKVLCSLRDILVEKEAQTGFEKKVLKWLNPYFDGVLVHSDPALIKLDQTFSRVQDIACPVWYTGYVAEGPTVADKAAARRELGFDTQSPIILVSAGSGTVGEELLLSSLEASILLQATLPHRLVMFTGPHAGADLHSRLGGRSRGQSHIVINEFTVRFPDFVLACDLSVSMAGYNTTMNLLACGTPGLMYPFDQNREQRMRLTALARAGYLSILEAADLVPTKLAGIMKNGLGTSPQPAKKLRLQGDRESAAIIFRLVNEELSK
jgi:predicted glycosyltransferase